MIAALDVPTLAFMASLVFLSVTGVLLLFYLSRRVYAGFGLWLLWQLSATAGVMVFALRGPDPWPGLYLLTQALLLTAPALLYHGLARFNDLYASNIPAISNYAIVAVALVLQAYFSLFSPDVDGRMIVYSLTRAFILIRCAVEPFRAATARRSASFWALTVIILVVVTNDLHHVWIAMQPGPVPDPGDSDSIRRALVAAVVADVIAAYILLLLTSERLEDELRAARHDIEVLARTDSLTGVWNRRHFEEIVQAEIARAQRYGTPLSLLTFDADHFKRINDGFGHHVGDDVLREIAQSVGAQIRRTDVLCRWGGEEFMVLAPGTDSKQAAVMAEKIRQGVATHAFAVGGPVTISVGVGEFAGGETMEDWLRRVDAALYVAKQSGRDRVVTADPAARAA